MDLKTVLRAQWDRATGVACTVLGALLLLVGWLGVSDTPFLAEQAPYILSGGVGGVFLLGVGATLWISADLRDEWRKLDRIETALQDGRLRFVDDEDALDLPSQRSDAGPEVYEDDAPRLDLSGPRHAAQPSLEESRKGTRSRNGSATVTDQPVAGAAKRRRAGVGHG